MTYQFDNLKTQSGFSWPLLKPGSKKFEQLLQKKRKKKEAIDFSLLKENMLRMAYFPLSGKLGYKANNMSLGTTFRVLS